MTIRFPDVSRYTPNVDVSKYPVILTKATQSDGTHGNIDETDPTFTGYRAAAKAAGTLCVAYHWLNHGNLKAQAAHCFSVVGPGMPVMIDAEDEPGNTGYNGKLTMADVLGFATEYRNLGGIVSLAYMPAWYWSGVDLRGLVPAGLGLVSSNYPPEGYTDTGPGWAPQGGITPVQWQYTDTPIDMNAYRGTVQDYAKLVGINMGNDFTPDDVNAWHEATRIDAFRLGLDTSAMDEDMTGFYRRVAKEVAGVIPAAASGLTDADRAAIQALTDAVNALNSRLASP